MYNCWPYYGGVRQMGVRLYRVKEKHWREESIHVANIASYRVQS